MSHFCIPKGYIENPVITFDIKEGDNYWDAARINTSISHQWHVYQWASKLIKKHGFKNVADVGCGFAYKLNILHQNNPQTKFWGIDQPNAIKLCKQHYKFGNWLGVDFENNPEQPEQKFDLVISSDVIEHLANPDALLNYIKSIVTPDGYILLSTPERDLLRGKSNLKCPNKAHVREWNRDEFARYLSSRGFRVLEHKILPARKPHLSATYLRKVVTRALTGRSMRYNQAVLLQVA